MDNSASNTLMRAFMRYRSHPSVEGLVNSLSQVNQLKSLEAVAIASDGGAYNETYSLANIVDDDNSVYCTRKPYNVTVLLELVHVKPYVVLSHVTVYAPSAGYTCPIRNGLVFGFHDKPTLSAVDMYNHCTREEYARMQATLQSNPKQREQHHPIGYFELEERERKVTIELDYKTNFRYVIVKLLSARQRNLTSDLRNIDIQRIELLGRTLPSAETHVVWA
eukprot:m.38484 g.38484  ORF g.38484 m.38484 type:complete len:221 (+) comp12592_c0_seq1:96-758(+)